MNEREWGKKFREETDDLLFGDLRFDESLKTKVREKIKAEAGTVEPESAEQTEAPQRTRQAFRAPRLRKAYGAVLAASFMVVVAATVSFTGILSPDSGRNPAEGNGGTELIATLGAEDGTPEFSGLDGGNSADASEHHAAPDPDAPQILLAPGETDAMEIVEAIELEDWQQAKQMFGDELRVPLHVPDGYEVVRIFAEKWGSDGEVDREANGEIDGEVARVIAQYASDEGGMFAYTQNKYATAFTPSDVDEPIDLHGMEGYLRTGLDHFELNWTDGTFAYQISGALSRDELIEVARSVGHE